MIINQLHIQIGMTKSILKMDPMPNFGVFSDFTHPFPYSYQRQGIFASEFHTLFFSIGTDVLNSLIYLVRGKFQRQKIPVPRLGAIQPVSGKTLEPNQRQIQYQNSVAKSEAKSEPKFRCQIRGKFSTKILLANQRQIQS